MAVRLRGRGRAPDPDAHARQFIRLRVFRSSVPSPHAQPQARAVVARWNDIMNSSARAT
jgi:hypothetical protein